MPKTAVINIHTEPEINAQAEQPYISMGVSLSNAVNYSGFPFELCREMPNAETIAAMKEADDIISGKMQAKSYASFQEMMDDALSEDMEE